MYKYFVSLIMIFIVFSCNNHKNNVGGFPEKPAEINSQNIIKRIYSKPTRIKIDLSKVIEGEFDDYFNLKNVILLDDKSPVGEISVVKQYKEKLFVLDKTNAKQLFCFSMSGELIWEFKANGKGPLEYKRIADFVINEKNKTIDVLDSGYFKVIQLDLSTGIAKTEFKLGCFGDAMILYTNGDYLLNTANFAVNSDLNYKLLLLNNGQQVNSRNLPIPEYEKAKHWSGFTSLERYEEVIFFTETLNDTIYTVKNDTLRARYYIDFMDKKYPKEVFDNYSSLKVKKLRKDKPFVSSIDMVREKNGVLSFMFGYDSEFYNVFYDIKKQKTSIFKNLKSGKSGLRNTQQIVIDGYIDDGFIRKIEPFVFNSDREAIGANEKYKEHLMENKPEMYNVIMNTDENSNPILFVYEYKKNN